MKMSDETKKDVPYERELVSIYRRSLNGLEYKIIDFHTHSHFESSIKWAKMWGWTIPFEGSTDELVRHMDAAGIEKSVILPSSFPFQVVLAVGPVSGVLEIAKKYNDLIARSVSKRPERLIGFARIPPLESEEVLDELERAVKMGLKGMGHFAVPSKDAPYRIIEKAAELKIPIEGSPPELLNSIAPSFPEVNFKFPNFCLSALHVRSIVEPSLKILNDNPNIYADIANTLTYQPDLCVKVMKEAGFENFVYGSDFPNIGYTTDHDISVIERYSYYVEKIPDEDWKKLFWDNAAKILGLKK